MGSEIKDESERPPGKDCVVPPSYWLSKSTVVGQEKKQEEQSESHAIILLKPGTQILEIL